VFASLVTQKLRQAEQTHGTVKDGIDGLDGDNMTHNTSDGVLMAHNGWLTCAERYTTD
jgi:hypothetical protein